MNAEDTPAPEPPKGPSWMIRHAAGLPDLRPQEPVTAWVADGSLIVRGVKPRFRIPLERVKEITVDRQGGVALARVLGGSLLLGPLALLAWKKTTWYLVASCDWNGTLSPVVLAGPEATMQQIRSHMLLATGATPTVNTRAVEISTKDAAAPWDVLPPASPLSLSAKVTLSLLGISALLLALLPFLPEHQAP